MDIFADNQGEVFDFSNNNIVEEEDFNLNIGGDGNADVSDVDPDQSGGENFVNFDDSNDISAGGEVNVNINGEDVDDVSNLDIRTDNFTSDIPDIDAVVGDISANIPDFDGTLDLDLDLDIVA